MAGEKKQITRNRASYSCQSCRRRKVRCDKQHPRCGGCIKLDEVCVYGEPDKPDSIQQSVVNTSSRKRRAPETDDALDEIDSQQSSFAFGAIGQQLSQLKNLIHDISRMTPVSISNSPDVERLDALSLSQHMSRSVSDYLQHPIKNALNHKVQHDGSPGHTTPWDNVLNKLDQLDILLKTGLRAQIASNSHRPGDRDPLQQPAGRPDPSRLGFLNPHGEAEPSSAPKGVDEKMWLVTENNDMLAPSEDESAALFRSWLWSVYPLLPIVSAVTAWKKYHEFFIWYRRGLDLGEPNPDPSFMPFIVFIWATGYANLSERAKQRWFSLTADGPTWIRAMRVRLEHYLSSMTTENQASIYSLAAAVSSQSLAIGGQDVMKNHVCNIVNIRAAQGLGIHNERTLKELSASDAETRRRLWWEVLSLDTSLSTVSGMPVVLDERYTDTHMPSELKESCMGTQDAMEYEAHLEEPGASPDRPDDPANWQTTSVVSVYHLVSRARHILTVATKNVLKANMSAAAMTMNELKEVRLSIQRVGNEIRTITNRIQTRGIPELEFVPVTNAIFEVDHLDEMGEQVTVDEVNYFLREETSFKGANPIMKHHRAVTIAFHKWARIMLSMSLERLECISYAPFLKNSKSRLWAVARNCALRSCHGYMRKFLSLAEDPQLRMFRWAWTSSSHPMHATIILLIDVHDRPHSYEASRSRAMIDKMFLLISPSKIRELSHIASSDILPLKEGGEEAWTMLRKLRYKAWQNAGLDPDVLWTEEDQTLVGVGKPLRENDLFIRSLRENIIMQHKQMKERENVRNMADYHSVFPSSPYNSPKHQRNHPSEVTQGDRVSGPVIRDVADLEHISVVPQILLLRARNDQELMPYPVTDRHPNPSHSQQQEQCDNVKSSSDQQNDEVEILHIGELIRKIQQSRSNHADKATPVPQMYTSLSSQPLPSATLLKDTPAVDFRTLRSVENAVYRDIFEGNSEQPMTRRRGHEFQHPPATNQPAASQPYFFGNTNQNLGHRSDDRTFPQTTSVESSTMVSKNSIISSDHISTVANSRTKATASYISEYNMQPSSNTAQHTHRLSPTAHVPTLPTETSTTINPTANDAADTGTAMDIEFDWNRWDEMFGQYAGFAEMLTSNEGDIVHGSDFAS